MQLIYLLSLQNKKKTRSSSASYNGKSSSYFHLCRLYGYKQSEEFMGQITVLFRGLKRCITKEKQDGDGKIQTGKIPMSFSLYRYIMNTCYVMTLLNLFLLVHFLLQLGILSAVQQTRAPSIYTTWITMKKILPSALCGRIFTYGCFFSVLLLFRKNRTKITVRYCTGTVRTVF